MYFEYFFIAFLFLKYKQKLTEIWNAKIFFAGTNFREYDLYKDFAKLTKIRENREN